MHDKILIIDFGSQVTQLIARRVRESRVYCEIHAFDEAEPVLAAWRAEGSLKGIVLSGGPSSVTETGSPRAPQAVFEAGVPILGICYGMQTMAEQLGGEVQAGTVREFGHAQVRATAEECNESTVREIGRAPGLLPELWNRPCSSAAKHAQPFFCSLVIVRYACRARDVDASCKFACVMTTRC